MSNDDHKIESIAFPPLGDGYPERAIDFLLERTPERAIAQPDLTFSADALDSYFGQVVDWIADQMIARWKATERPVHRMRLSVVLAFDEELDDPRRGGKTNYDTAKGGET
jgi:hypothetical protein